MMIKAEKILMDWTERRKWTLCVKDLPESLRLSLVDMNAVSTNPVGRIAPDLLHPSVPVGDG